MENGSFQSHLPHHDFSEELAVQRPSVERARPESSTAKILMQQIDDLQARLKVSMQRLSSLEEELQFSQQEQSNLENRNRGLQDQLQIWREKERLWLERVEKADLSLRQAQTREEEKVELTAELQRYRKYHEKVKTQIKPYIAQLKEYSKNLLFQSQELGRELANSEFNLTKARAEIRRLEVELGDIKTTQSQSQKARAAVHEAEIQSLQESISQLRQDLAHHQSRSERLDHALERQDELENTCVALRREIEHAQNLLSQETEGLRVSLQLSRNDLLKRNLKIESLEQSQQDQANQLHRLQSESANSQEQLVSLRFLWNEKSAECERLQSRLQALEKLNLELSQKLNQQRRQPEPGSNL